MSAGDVHYRPLASGDAEAIARVQVTSWEETYRGLIPDVVIDRMVAPEGFPARWRARLAGEEEMLARTTVAELEGADGSREMVGFVSYGASRNDEHGCPGEIWALYLVRAAQGRGIGRRLVEDALEELGKVHLRPAYVRVLADNPSRQFYGHIGGVEIDRRQCHIQEAPHLDEVTLRYK